MGAPRSVRIPKRIFCVSFCFMVNVVNVSDGNSEDSDLAIHNCTEFDCYETVKEATGPTNGRVSSDRFPIFSDIAIMLVHFGLIHGSFDFILSWILHIFWRLSVSFWNCECLAGRFGDGCGLK